MDDDERQYGDSDAQEENARNRELRRRAMWRPSIDDPYPDWTDKEDEE